jgi:hypothetical protein
MTGRLTATVHDASRCTFDGRPCWIAALAVDGRFRPDVTGLFGSTLEADTRAGALAAAAALLRARGVDPVGRIAAEARR